MPDHTHALLSFPRAESIRGTMRDWKRYTARHLGIAWQRDFFEHRVRNGESLELKAAYIRENPVRKGLVARAEDWPWVIEY
jgi:REP element-mobilizing transposase RayT